MPADADLDMILQTRPADRFDPMSEAERKLLAALPAGLDSNCGPDGLAWDAPENDPARADTWDHDRTIRAALLAWLCADAKATEQIHHLGIQLTGARIDGVFDLSFVNVPFPLSFDACYWPQGMRFRGAAIPELRLRRCRIGPLPLGGDSNTAIVAAGLRVQNTVLLSDGFHAEGAVQLSDADIGILDCSRGSRFTNPDGQALNADRAKIGGIVFLCDDFQAEGEVSLLEADIGILNCSGGRFKNANGLALHAARAKIGGPVFLCDDFQAEGEVNLLDADIGALECSRGSRFKNANGLALHASRAKIGGPVFLREDFQAEGEVRLLEADIGLLDCSGGRFKNANGPALNADRAKIGGIVFLCDDFQAEGEVSLAGATVRGNVVIANGRSAVTDGTPTFSLTLYGARIDGALNMRGLRCARDTVVNLEDTSCNVLIDEKEGWPSAGNLILDGFVYRRLSDPLTPAIRLDWLRRELPSDEGERRGRFRPQPYRQLAGVLRAQGLDTEAKAVLIGMAQDRRKWANLGTLSRFWQFIMWITIRNGYQPQRAGYGLLVLWLVGFLAFGLGYQMQVMAPSERFAYDGFAQGALPGYYEPFCALVYSIDTSLPIIGFGQKDRWHPRLMETPPPLGGNDGVSGPLCKADFTRRLDPNSVWVSRATLATSLEVYRWFHLAFGWFLATMLLAGISGLVGRE